MKERLPMAEAKQSNLQIRSRIDGDIVSLLEKYGGPNQFAPRDIDQMFSREASSENFDVLGSYGGDLRFNDATLALKFLGAPPRDQTALVNALRRAMEEEKQTIVTLKISWRDEKRSYATRWLIVRRGVGIFNDNPNGLTFSLRDEAPV
jgi:hypothetical protein